MFSPSRRLERNGATFVRAYTASKINGKTIKNATVAGKKLKPDSVTGKQVNESKLGTVPKATSAETTAMATNATNASDSAKVAG